MSAIDLKVYITRAVELESAIYTQKKLMNEHQDLMRYQRPASPKKPNLQPPVKPSEPANLEPSGGFNWFMLIIAIPILIACIACTIAVPLLGLFMLAACGYGFYNILSNQSKDKDAAKDALKKYENDMVDYNRQMEDYHKRYQIAHDNYSNLLQNWNVRVDEYDQKSSVITKQHNSMLESLELALQKHYEQNVIFPKYRNLVAITTINEYLMSGRCYELEGPNGAYN